MRVDDIMSRNVITVEPSMPLKAVAERMVDANVTGVPVVEDGRVVGVISETDIVMTERKGRDEPKGLLGLLLLGPDAITKMHATTAREAMSSPPVTIDPTRTVAEAAAEMVDGGVNRLPVVDAKGALVGIVTRTDLVRAFVRPDEEIAREISEDVVLRQLWIDPRRVQVEVAAGVVTLSGEVEAEAEAQVLETVVGRVPGVLAVVSKVTWPTG